MAKLFKILIVLLLLCGGLSLSAQSHLITINESEDISSLIRRYKTLDPEELKLKAFRILILSSPDRRQVEKVQATFERKYRDYKAEWKYDMPYYKLMTGAFLSYGELYPFLLEVRKEYPGATDIIAEATYQDILESKK